VSARSRSGHSKLTLLGAATTFDALGTYVYLATSEPAELDLAEELARQVVRDIDETCSRFREDSDLSEVNRRPGERDQVDLLLVEAIKVAISAAEQTNGLVHPLLGRPIVSLGYDRDFAEIPEDTSEAFHPSAPPPAIDAWRRIFVDPAGAVQIPEETALDLGATAKAWAADLISLAMSVELKESAIVSLGGDVAVSQHEREAGITWPIAISEVPGTPAEETFQLDGGGLATSSTQVRRWHRGGARRHHLLDPRTGLPCTEQWRTVTATGPSCTAANIASTAAIVMGGEALAWLDEHGVSARLVDTTGAVRTIGAWTPS